MAVHDEESDLAGSRSRTFATSATHHPGPGPVREHGHMSFNFSLYSAKGGETVGFRCVFKIVNRPEPLSRLPDDDYFCRSCSSPS